ncbi:MAG TPA: hypothetical protein DCM24_01190 [Synergistaceae bacterium]|nr:hypothetical protein [Synergistaceae bacterium]
MEGDIMNWKERMPAPVRDMEFAEYATSREGRPVLVDCALGTNPLGSPDCVRKLIGTGRLPDPGGYPGDDLPFRKALSDSWKGIFSPDEVIIGTGSIGLIISLARTFCATGAAVLGVTPQFPDGPMHFQLAGASYRQISLTPPGYELEVSRIAEAMIGDESIIYIDRPHNPTGQVPDLEEMAFLAEKCRKQGSILIVDEAYGDFLPPGESALNLLSPSMVVLRSFSKGRGLAGIRAGYCIIRDGEARRYLRKVAPPFPVSAMAMEMATASLLDGDYARRSRETAREVKARVIDTIKRTGGVSVARTHPEVPILLASLVSGQGNLYEILMEQGIRTEPGTGFTGLGPESVRLRIPAPEQLETFQALWRKTMEKGKVSRIKTG